MHCTVLYLTYDPNCRAPQLRYSDEEPGGIKYLRKRGGSKKTEEVNSLYYTPHANADTFTFIL